MTTRRQHIRSNPMFAGLVEHFDAFSEAERQALAARYGVPATDPTTLARTFCARPERVLEVLEEHLPGAAAWQLVEELAYDHDLLVDIAFVTARMRRQLVQLGLLKPSGRDSKLTLENSLPGAIASILAPRLQSSRASLPILLGRMGCDDLRGLGRRLGVSLPTQGSRVELLMELAQVMSASDFLQRVLDRLDDPEWIGAALMTLELGGMCYWQEVFGHDLEAHRDDVASAEADGPAPVNNVVPLLGRQDRLEEEAIADSLIGLGLLHRIEEPGNPYPLVVIPEELWGGLWALGRDWLMDWTAEIFYGLREGAVRRQVSLEDARDGMKWLACEADHGRLRVEASVEEEDPPASGKPPYGLCEISRQRIREARSGDEEQARRSERLALLARELGLFVEDARGTLAVDEAQIELLDAPRPSFVRRVLHDWCTCRISARADEPLAQALGLDETWRGRVVAALQARQEVLPPWLLSEGLDTSHTGAGCLRDPALGGPEVLMMELGLTNSYVWSTKLLWLDLISMQEADCHYPLDALRELLQMAAALTLFGHLSSLIEMPGFSYYLPVQRASFLHDPFHTDAFDSWLRAIVAELLEPLGVARLEEDGRGASVWLDTRHLRVETPMGMQDEQRIEQLRDLLQMEELDFKPPCPTTPSLLALDFSGNGNGAGGGGWLAASLPLARLRQELDGRSISGFDGERILLEESP